MEAITLAELARQRTERRARRRLWVSLVLAFVLHLLGGGLWALFERVEARSVSPPARPVTLRPLTAQQWATNRGASARNLPSTLPQLRPDQPKPPEQRPKGQVVDVAQGNHQETPDAKYLAESSNRVEKETRAKEQTPNYQSAQPQRTSPTPQTGAGNDVAAQVSGNDGTGSDSRPRQSATHQGASEIPRMQKHQQLAMRLDPHLRGEGPSVSNHSETQSRQGNASRLNLQPGELGPQSTESSDGRAGPRGPINLFPSASVLDRISGAAPNDHLADVDEGEGTFLNTKEWKYAGFFNRVKQSVGAHWDPSTSLKGRDPSGQIYSGRDRYTVLQITLDASGSLRDVSVEKSSGLEFLDQEAISSFRRAQPFPNPPSGLLTADSTVKFSFGFFLELGSGSRMRLFRGPGQ